MAEMRGRKGPGRRSGRETEGPEMRWTKYIRMGRLVGRLIRTKDWTESWIRKKTAGNHLETVGSHKQNERSPEKCIKKLREMLGKLQRKGEKLRIDNRQRCDEG